MRVFCLAAMILLCGTASASLAQAITGSVIVVDAPTDAGTTIFERDAVAGGSTLQTLPDNRVAVYLTAGSGPAVEIGLYIEPESSLSVAPSTATIPWHLSIETGSALVRFAARKDVRAPLVVSAPPGWARVEPGSTIWITVKPDAAAFRLVEGAGAQFDGRVPEAGPTTLPGGQALSPQADLRTEATALVDRLLRARTTAAGMNWVYAASLGELVPRPKSARVVARSSEYVRVTAVTPRVVAPSTTAQLPVTAVVTPVTSEARLLLASQNPASVLVGARLERTRIVGNPGTGTTGSGIRFNPQVRGPLQLGGR